MCGNKRDSGNVPCCCCCCCCWLCVRSVSAGSLDWGFRAGAGPITNGLLCMVSRRFVESGCLRLQPKAGGKSHPRLNIRTRPIANKYREGKLKRTLKREFNRT
ncbi:hypothetical protein T4E_514 [Trichinella pseudospiralis]|uniref:Secreted protein n=1 Tax=Trichinella pseudospiralis TaxID=6337 RepID=A0A0V0XEY2_TRIPS|nr:hypothetical protein T4E_514 [Trichinella pseudospiralis]